MLFIKICNRTLREKFKTIKGELLLKYNISHVDICNSVDEILN